tara:strand:- start:96 stop:953 length:858 start_codon:yes stop_codon:yes gene_type:complete
VWAKLNSDRDAIEEIIVNTKGMLIDGITYPKALFTLWTDAQRLDIDIVPVTTTGSHLDTDYYTEQDATYEIAGDKESVVRTIGVKDSDRTLATVKSEQISNVKTKCNMLLAPTDWYITRKSERSVAIPDKIIAFRAAVLAVYTAAKSAINGAANIGALVTVNTNSTGATASITVDGTSTGVVSASNNTVTKNSHGFVDDEALTYDDGQASADKPIKGLVSGQNYYVHTATTNTFKLSLTPSSFGDEAVISLTGVADAGTQHKFTSLGIRKTRNDWPTENNLAYKL